MKSHDRQGGLIAHLRAAADGALRRLGGAPAAGPAPAEPALFGAGDPTIGLFGDSETGETEGSLPLRMQLEMSARRMGERAQQLNADSRRLAARIADRAAAEVTLATQAVRVLIGLAWLGVAVWLYNGALVAAAGDFATLENGMPAGDALVLSRTFMIVAALGLGVAFAVAAIVSAAGRGGNEQVRRAADTLGQAIADASREFDEDIRQARERMNRRAAPVDAVNDLSRAHVTALEAQDYFRRMPFLTGLEGEDAAGKFKDYIDSVGKSGPPPALAVFLLGLLLGAWIGAAYVFVNYAPRPEPVEPATPLAIAKYPWALNLLLLGGLAYAAAGIVISLFSGAVSMGAAARARAEALDALRGAFTAREAPRPGDIAQRIQDAVDVFKAQVGGPRSGGSIARTNHPGGTAGDLAGEADDVPSWRRRDSSVKFVETGFSAAPARWRTDAYAKKLTGEPEAKRDLPGGPKRRGE